MLELVTGYWISQMLFAVARLGVPDVVASRALPPGEIAAKVGAHPGYLRRVLRALATVGVFAEDARGRFRATPLGRTLRADVPGSLRDFTLMMVDGHNCRAWESLLDAVKSGKTAFDLAHGQAFFEYLQQHPEQDREFSASMASVSATENDAVARAWPFGKLRQLVDLGGAHGHLLAAVLRRHKKLRGVLYDQPQVVAHAPASGFVTAPAVRDRIAIQGGSFFDSVPKGADGYLMKYIIHDWDDEKAGRILGLCREAMAPGGRVLVVDRVIKPGNHPDWSKWLDVNMLVIAGGKERTRADFEALFAKAGLALVKIHPTRSPVSIVEARAG